jgi:hypothetical protein
VGLERVHNWVAHGSVRSCGIVKVWGAISNSSNHIDSFFSRLRPWRIPALAWRQGVKPDITFHDLCHETIERSAANCHQLRDTGAFLLAIQCPLNGFNPAAFLELGSEASVRPSLYRPLLAFLKPCIPRIVYFEFTQGANDKQQMVPPGGGEISPTSSMPGNYETCIGHLMDASDDHAPGKRSRVSTSFISPECAKSDIHCSSGLL